MARGTFINYLINEIASFLGSDWLEGPHEEKLVYTAQLFMSTNTYIMMA